MRQVSRVTSKFQATIPLAVRRKLGLKPGDAVVFEIEDDAVTVRDTSEEGSGLAL